MIVVSNKCLGEDGKKTYMCSELFEFLMFEKFFIYIFIKYLDVFLYIISHV